MRDWFIKWLRPSSLALLVGATSAHAQPVQWAYRVDARPPAIIFNEGFQSRGRSSNLFNHLFLDSCFTPILEQRSAWVTAIADSQTAYSVLAHSIGTGLPLTTHQGMDGLWLYAIHTDSSYLGIFSVMQQAISAGEQGQLGYTYAHAQILQQLVFDRQVANAYDVVTFRVFPSNIFSAVFVAVDRDRQGVHSADHTLSLNTRYQAPSTQITAGTADVAALVPPQSIDLYQTATPHTCNMFCDSSARTERRQRSVGHEESYCLARPTMSQLFIGGDD